MYLYYIFITHEEGIILNRRFLYLLLTFVIIITISGIGQASERKVDSHENEISFVYEGDNNQSEVDISLEKASMILRDILLKQSDKGELEPVAENPLVEIVGFTNPTSNNVYYVKSGDSLYKIAERYNTSIDVLKGLNNISSNYLYIGQELQIPEEENQLVYYVKSGDSLYKLAREYSTTTSRIKELNNLRYNYLYVGQKLIIPLPKTETGYTYYVKPGDSLYKIAAHFNSTVQDIKNLNNIYSNYLYVGQKLRIRMDVVKEGYGTRLSINDQEMDLMARAVYSEARGEPYKGQVAIAAVIINRVLHPLFPNTVRGVIFQPWQFTAVHDGQFWLEPNQVSYTASKAALDGWDPSGGAIYYYNPETATSRWVFYRQVILKIGQHYFAI